MYNYCEVMIERRTDCTASQTMAYWNRSGNSGKVFILSRNYFMPCICVGAHVPIQHAANIQYTCIRAAEPCHAGSWQSFRMQSVAIDTIFTIYIHQTIHNILIEWSTCADAICSPQY